MKEQINPGSGAYRIDVENFGPIMRASVDLRPLTVFVGPSNTGKSYLAILIYALHRCFNGGAGLGVPTDWPIPRLVRRRGSNSRISKKLLARMADPSAAHHRSLPEDAMQYIRPMLERPEHLRHYLEGELRRCFGVDAPGDLMRRSTSVVHATVGLNIPGTPDAVRYELRIEGDGVAVSGALGDPQSLRDELKVPDDLAMDARAAAVAGDEHGVTFLLDRAAERVLESLLRPLHRNAYYLPADRTGVMHSHQVVVSTLVQNAATAGLRPSGNIPMLSGVLADFLSQLIAMGGRRRRRVASGELASRLEANVLKGAVHLEKTGIDYPRFAYRPDGWSENLPLMRASSMVSELAPVILYLRHLVQPDDVLIIEEPESHLHPAMQVAFTREIAAIVRAGVKVIVTTHSEWLLEELANLVRLSQVPEGRRTGMVWADVALDPAEVGAWLFTPRMKPKGSIVSEVTLDEDSGLYPSGFDEVATTLHNDWAEIGSRS